MTVAEHDLAAPEATRADAFAPVDVESPTPGSAAGIQRLAAAGVAGAAMQDGLAGAPPAGSPRAGGGAPRAMSPEMFLMLQRRAGNQSVARMLARQEEEEVPKEKRPPSEPPWGLPPKADNPFDPFRGTLPLAPPPAAAAPPSAAPAWHPPMAPPPQKPPPPPPVPPSRAPAVSPPDPMAKPAPAPGQPPEHVAPPPPPAPPPVAPGGGPQSGPRLVQDPRTGIDWDAMWDNPTSALSAVRVPLEVLRGVPGFGLVTGVTSDAIGVYQDFAQISGEEAPFTKTVLAIRSAVMITNSAIGHISYVNQLVQDGLAVSVLGAEFVPLTAATNTALKYTKIVLDGAMLLLDVGLQTGALYRESIAPPGSDSAKNFQAMANNFTAYLYLDHATAVIDVLDLFTGGASNAEVVKTGGSAIRAILTGAESLHPMIQTTLMGWLGIFGGSGVAGRNPPRPGKQGAVGTPPRKTTPGSKSAPIARSVARQAGGAGRGAASGGADMSERVAAGIILTELHSIKSVYGVGDFLLGEAGDLMEEMIAQLSEVATLILGGKDPFTTARDSGEDALKNLSESIGELEQMEALSKSSVEYAAEVTMATDLLLGLVDSLKVPDVEIPQAEIGDNVFADLAEGVINTAGGFAEDALQALVDEVGVLVEELKPMVREPVEDLKAEATEVGDFMEIFGTVAREQITWAAQKLEDVAEKIGNCETIEDVIDLMIAEVMGLLGIEGTFEVDDVRQAWVALGAEIDEAIVWATGVLAGADEEDDEGEGGG